MPLQKSLFNLGHALVLAREAFEAGNSRRRITRFVESEVKLTPKQKKVVSDYLSEIQQTQKLVSKYSEHDARNLFAKLFGRKASHAVKAIPTPYGLHFLSHPADVEALDETAVRGLAFPRLAFPGSKSKAAKELEGRVSIGIFQGAEGAYRSWSTAAHEVEHLHSFLLERVLGKYGFPQWNELAGQAVSYLIQADSGLRPHLNKIITRGRNAFPILQAHSQAGEEKERLLSFKLENAQATVLPLKIVYPIGSSPSKIRKDKSKPDAFLRTYGPSISQTASSKAEHSILDSIIASAKIVRRPKVLIPFLHLLRLQDVSDSLPKIARKATAIHILE